jgi:hypothetical protein
MANNLINSGVHLVNSIPNVKQKTLIVMGSPRSGTSMIGKVLYSLGVFKGKIDQAVYEDSKIIEVLENNKPEQYISEYFSKQNSLYDTWGFKRPGAFFYIRKFEHLVRNPIYIVPFKDILSISMRKNISIGQDFNNALKETLAHHNKLVDFILTSEIPMLLFSYEKAMLDPEQFIHSVISHLNLNCSNDKINKAIQSIENNPKNYLNGSRERVNGSVDNINNGYISGWAKATNHNKPVEICIFANKKPIKTVVSNIYRADLEKANIGNGEFAFKIKTDDLGLLKGDKIKVVAGIHKDELKNSPLIY